MKLKQPIITHSKEILKSHGFVLRKSQATNIVEFYRFNSDNVEESICFQKSQYGNSIKIFFSTSTDERQIDLNELIGKEHKPWTIEYDSIESLNQSLNELLPLIEDCIINQLPHISIGYKVPSQKLQIKFHRNHNTYAFEFEEKYIKDNQRKVTEIISDIEKNLSNNPNEHLILLTASYLWKLVLDKCGGCIECNPDTPYSTFVNVNGVYYLVAPLFQVVEYVHAPKLITNSLINQYLEILE